jgi:hypothetical protein
MKTQVDYKPKQPFFQIKDKTVWFLVDITEVKSLVLDAKPRTIVHLYNEETKKMKRLRFAEFESQFELILSSLPDKVIFFNQCLDLEF